MQQHSLNVLSRMRQLLASLERDLGLVSLPKVELDLLYAIDLLAEDSSIVITSAEIRKHPLLDDVPTATFNRALKSLIKKGYIEHPPESRAKHYRKTRNWLASLNNDASPSRPAR